MSSVMSLAIFYRRFQLLFALLITFMPISLCAQNIVTRDRVQGDLEERGDNVVYMGGNFAQAPVDNRAISRDVALQPDLDNGSTIYDNACAACHGETGQGAQGRGPALSSTLDLSEIMLVVNDGRNTMPAFDVFTDQELVDISTFVAEQLHQ